MDRQQALERFIIEEGEQLLRLAYTYVKNKQTAEDIVQDVLLKAFERIDQFQGRASYKTYLMRMTINRSMDYLRSWHYKNIILTEKISVLIKKPPSTQAEHPYPLAEAILQLPVKYREVIVLHYYEDLTQEQIATLLQLSVNTVKTRLVRGRERLKTMLKEEFAHESFGSEKTN